MDRILKRFKLLGEKEEYSVIIKNITDGISFRGTNLWILIFAIFIASLGLNVNSTAVIIGAMLISPLMGPILGLGLGLGINDLVLLRRALSNYVYAVIVGLITSTFYFILTPLNDAHSELLSRTYPTIYDVLIAFFGGLAGIVATSSKLKGNVIPGVAIATALMPPLCTAGYGLATLQWNFFFGAFYLFIINTVFIAIATFVTVRLLKIPHKVIPDIKTEKTTKRIIIILLFTTLAPSIYLGYDIVMQDRFNKSAVNFIEKECIFTNNYLLNKKIDAKNKSIVLTYGGEIIPDEVIKKTINKLENYSLQNTTLKIKQGFSYLTENKESSDQLSELSYALQTKNHEIINLQFKLDSIININDIGKQIYAELTVEYTHLVSLKIARSTILVKNNSSLPNSAIILLKFKKQLSKKEKSNVETWLKVRLNDEKINVIFED